MFQRTEMGEIKLVFGSKCQFSSGLLALLRTVIALDLISSVLHPFLFVCLFFKKCACYYYNLQRLMDTTKLTKISLNSLKKCFILTAYAGI